MANPGRVATQRILILCVPPSPPPRPQHWPASTHGRSVDGRNGEASNHFTAYGSASRTSPPGRTRRSLTWPPRRARILIVAGSWPRRSPARRHPRPGFLSSGVTMVPYYTRDLRGYRDAFHDASLWLECKLPYWRWHVEVYRACRDIREATWSPEENAPNTARELQDVPGGRSGRAL